MNRNPCPLPEKGEELIAFLLVEGREARERLPYGTVERRRNSPNAAIPVGTLFKLVELIFFYAIWRIGDYSVDGILGNDFHPLKAVGVDDDTFPNLSVGVT